MERSESAQQTSAASSAALTLNSADKRKNKRPEKKAQAVGVGKKESFSKKPKEKEKEKTDKPVGVSPVASETPSGLLVDALVAQHRFLRQQRAAAIKKNNKKVGVFDAENGVFTESEAAKVLATSERSLVERIESLKSETKLLRQKTKRNKQRQTADKEVASTALVQLETKLLFAVRELATLQSKRAALLAKKQAHIQLALLDARERSSVFGGFPRLGNYLLLNLLGFGGFSEVYKAVDLSSCQLVAAKLHQLESDWSALSRAGFVRRVHREVAIQSKFSHPNVLRLRDSFLVDADCLCTVLEFAEAAKDLEQLLKEEGRFSEKEARLLFLQLLQGVAAMRSHGVIHYDLKPANLLFVDGTLKITDFGLSKVFAEESPNTNKNVENVEIELTSVGAGTYHYMAPECFEANPFVSSKTDVWAAGAVFYQLLFGKKPFGEGVNPHQLWRNGGTHFATGHPDFPKEPKVSIAAKHLIQDCLNIDPKARPSVEQLLQNKYFDL